MGWDGTGRDGTEWGGMGRDGMITCARAHARSLPSGETEIAVAPMPPPGRAWSCALGSRHGPPPRAFAFAEAAAVVKVPATTAPSRAVAACSAAKSSRPTSTWCAAIGRYGYLTVSSGGGGSGRTVR